MVTIDYVSDITNPHLEFGYADVNKGVTKHDLLLKPGLGCDVYSGVLLQSLHKGLGDDEIFYLFFHVLVVTIIVP